MSELGSDARSGIGARLRAGREKMGLTQLQTAEKLHVDPKVVESLEAERFEVLGAPVFVRGHLKRYAELIGEQTAELLELYAAAAQAALPDLTKLPKAAPESHPSRLAVPALVVLIGFVLLGVVWWVVKSVGGPQIGKPTRGPQPVAIAPEVSPDPAVLDLPAGEVAPSGDAGDAGDAAGAGEAAAARAKNVTSPDASTASVSGVSGARSRDALGPRSASSTPGSGASAASPSAAGTARAPSAGTTTAGAGSASASAAASAVPSAGAGSASAAAPAATVTSPTTATRTSASPTPAAPSAVKPMELTLRFAADSWVEVYDANGAKLFYDVGTAASSRTVSGTPPFRVHVANAPGVSLDVNGKPATVPANAVKGDEAQFVINRSGRIVRARPQADGG